MEQFRLSSKSFYVNLIVKSPISIALPLMILMVPTIAFAGDDVNPGDIIINEIMQNPNAVFDEVGEWFEIVNITDDPINIDGWTIKDDGSDEHIINNSGSLIVPPHNHVVLCRNSNSGVNGGVTCDYAYGTDIQLANSADEVVLIDDATIPEEIDRVNYDGGTIFPNPTGASMSYGGPDTGSPAPYLDNDTGTRWADATSSYGNGDLGTPGAKNDDVLGPTAVSLQSITASTLTPPMVFLAVSIIIVALFSSLLLFRRKHS